MNEQISSRLRNEAVSPYVSARTRLFLRSCIALLALIAAHSAIAGRRAAAADKLPDIATVRAAVEFYSASIKTLEGKYVRKLSRGPESISKNRPEVQSQDLKVEITFAADLVRRTTFFDDRRSYFLFGKNGEKVPFEIHWTTAFDGTRHYNMTYTHVRSPVETDLAPDIPYDLNISRHDATQNQSTPWDYSGLRLRMLDSLAAVLRNPFAKIDGHEKVAGIQCVRVVMQSGKEDPTFIAWLDPAHDFLPRRLTCPKPPHLQGNSSATSIKFMEQHEILEFRRFPDPLGGGEKWFPVRGRERNWLDEIYDDEIVELKINSTIDSYRFSIQTEGLVDGVRINDSTGERREASYTGGRQDLWEDRKRQLDDETKRMGAVLLPASSGPAATVSGATGTGADGLPMPTITAVISTMPVWKIGLIAAGSAALLAVGMISIVRNRRKRLTGN